MSLINDALKRAKSAQDQAPGPAAPAPNLHPAEPAQEAIRGVGLAMPIGLALAALIALFFAWQVWQRANGDKPVESQARTVAATPAAPVAPDPVPSPELAAAPAPQPVPAPVSLSSKAPPAPAAAVPQPTPSVPAPETVTPTPPAQETATVPVAESLTVSNSVVVVVEPPKPGPLKLQAIIFSPTRPSALISGKSVFLGDRVGDQRVVAITRETATVAGNGQTNVLRLAE